MEMTAPKLASRSTILPLWVNLYATIPHVVPTDGRASRLLSRYECTLEHNTMQGYIINVVENAKDWVNRVWMIHMQKEWLTVSRSGVE